MEAFLGVAMVEMVLVIQAMVFRVVVVRVQVIQQDLEVHRDEGRLVVRLNCWVVGMEVLLAD